ncbi:hypothetical protein [Streptomyces sporangiiformans]|uniref:Glycogen debranching protein n=1 Tax=Streptomyces sporangiiformans TaxID=2315329 RepID=A0A505D3B0_9ACTN|nr:hypothetical protein [Streptomyces sporangiiformans]TPQ17080.1 hypothetical protein FGD71_038285 [Streptomyces sporangiiformans]
MTDRQVTSSTIDFRHAPASSWTLLCRPDDPHKSLVREDGALLYGFHASGFDAWSFARTVGFSAQTTHRPVRVTQETESARRAIVRTVVTYPNQTLEMTTFAHYGPARYDVVLWTVTAAPGEDEVLTGLRIDAQLRGETLASTGSRHEVHAVPLDTAPATPEWTDGLPTTDVVPAGAWRLRSCGHPLVGGSAQGFGPADGLVTRPVVLRGSESVSGAVVVPLADGHLDLDQAYAALQAERRYWDRLDVQRLPLTVPDPDVQDMLTACARNLLQAREVEQDLPVLHVGPTIYRGLWLVDGHFLLEAARYLGLDDTADAGLEVLMRRVKPNGAIVQLDSEPYVKETGIAIATMVRQAEITGDSDGLRGRWPTVRGAVAHIAELREQAAELPADHPLRGLLPEAFGDGGLGGSRAEYTTTMWILTGLRYAVAGARMLGEAADAERFADLFDSLLSAFQRSAKTQRRTTADGLRHLPMNLPGSGEHQFLPRTPDSQVPVWRRIRPETATWALCHAIWPGEIFAADDEVVRDLLDLYEARDDEQGIPATTGWLPYKAVWTYQASFAAHAWLYADRPDKAADYLYAFANHASPTRVWREEQPLTGSGHLQICGDMPHNWASAEFVRLVRHLLVFERGAGLDLLPAAPAHWFRPGAEIRVEGTPTRFGRVGLDVRAGENRLEIRVLRQGPDTVPARLRLPARFSRGGARVDGRPVAAAEELRLELPDGAPVLVEADC